MGVLGAWLVLAGVLSAADEQSVVAKIRAYAQHYGGQLQDFTCTKITARSVDGKELDTLSQELSYVGHKESYRLLRITGKPAPEAPTIKGEFEGLSHLFDPRANVELVFDHRDGDTCVTRYHATLESGVALHFRKGDKNQAMAHHGFVFANCSTGVVSRFQMATDPVKGKSDALEADITYGPVTIDGKQFILPLTADDLHREGKKTTKAVVKFTNYKKYGSRSEIRFDGDN